MLKTVKKVARVSGLMVALLAVSEAVRFAHWGGGRQETMEQLLNGFLGLCLDLSEELGYAELMSQTVEAVGPLIRADYTSRKRRGA